MALRRQDISVLLLYYFGYSKIRNFAYRLQRTPLARFVTFHDIMPESVICFERNLLFLKKRTNVVSLDDFFKGRLSSEKINVVITFDDGYKGWISYAIPALKRFKLPAVFFVSSGFVGLSKEEEEEYMQLKLFRKMLRHRTTGGLSHVDLRRIIEEGFIVGGHTLNHCNISEINDISLLGYEIIEDKKRLETVTESAVDYFAYPSGDYQNPFIDSTELLIEAGYKGAVTTVPGFNRIGTNPYLLNRDLTSSSMPWRTFRARVYGNFDAIRFIKRLL